MTSNRSDDQILEFQRTVANAMVTKLNTVMKDDSVTISVEMIASRIVASGNSLAVLRNNAVHDYAFDAASILRNIYDVMLQGLYILADPAEREKRAKLYLDFMNVERVRRIELMDKSDTDIAKRFSGSPRRAGAEPAIRKSFDAVKQKYMNKNGNIRHIWYPGNLRNLAKASGLEPEYEIMQKFLSGVVHSSPLTLEEGPIVRDLSPVDLHWQFAFRILGAYADYKGIALNQTESDLIHSARKNVFDWS